MSPQEKKVADSKRKAEKGGKFVTLAQKRASKAIKAIRNCGNLANRSSYDYNEAQVRQLIGALANEVKALETRFTATKSDKVESAFVFSA